MRRLVCASLAATLILATRLFAAAPVYSNSFASVTLDGVRLGTDLDPSDLSLFPSVVYDPATATFHMWVIAGATQSVEDIRHATSSDGVHFTSTGNLSFAGGNPFPAYGAAAEPPFVFPRVASLGTDWKLLLWTHNDSTPGVTGDYNYNESVNSLGPDPATLAVAHQGPAYPTNGLGTYGQTTGPLGMVNGKLYVADDRPGGMSKWSYNDTTPPSVDTPADHFQDLITGTGYVFFLTHPGDPLGVYVHNVGRVLDQGDGTLGVYYSLRYPDGSRVNKQIYYAQSGDGGQSWSTPVGLFSNGAAIRVDGGTNAFEFSHPEVTLVGLRRVLYFSTKADNGQFVVATSAAQGPSPGSWADLVGSGQGDGESAVQVVRTPDGGYVLVAQTWGFESTAAAFWLVKLDGTGEVEWQKIYASPGTVSPHLFAVSALARAADGGFVAAGFFMDQFSKMWMLKTDQAGNVVWSKIYSTCDGGNCGNRISGLIPTADGGFAFGGSVAGTAGTFGLGKIDADGNLLWIHAYPTNPSSDSWLVVETSDGDLIAGGGINVPPVYDDYRVMKTDSAGAPVWDEQIGAAGYDFLSAMTLDATGDLVLAGSGPSPASALQLMSLDASGAIVWQRGYYDPTLGRASAIVPTADGGFGLAGVGASGNASRALLLELDASGAIRWTKTFSSLPTDPYRTAGFSSLVPTLDGGFLAVGSDIVYPDSRVLALKVDSGGGFVGCLDVEVSGSGTQSIPAATSAPLVSTVVDQTANTTVADMPVTLSDTDAAERVVCRATLPTELAPAALAVDPFGNGVAEPGEEFLTAPSWTNFGPAATLLTGHTSAVSDTNGLDTTDPDLDAVYGTVPSLVTADCEDATGDCYLFRFLSIPRPSQHWDTYFDETLSTSDPHHRWAKRWTIHAGLSFDDEPPSSGFYSFVETIFHNGITAGCGGLAYCPDASTTRAQMAVFLLKAQHGADYVPPACTPGAFGDVACPGLFADWIEQLANEGITAGCGGGNYCPNDPVTRQQMAVFLLKARNGPAYTPQACFGIFGDVACPSLFADWIEDLYNRQITAGCSASPLLYCPTDPNTRAQMAVFLTKTFSLLLYGP